MINKHTYYEAADLLNTLIDEMGKYNLIDALYYYLPLVDIANVSIADKGIISTGDKCIKVVLNNGITMHYEGQALIDLLDRVINA